MKQHIVQLIAQVKSISQLATQYCVALIDAERFKDSCIASEEFYHLLKEKPEFKKHRARLSIKFAESLRMLEKRQQAIDIFNETLDEDDGFLSNKEKSSIYLSLALAYKGEGNKPAAIDAARKARQIADKDSTHYIQATSIIYYCEGGQLEKLITLEKKARRNNYISLANTIAFTIAEDKDSKDKADICRRVLETKGDYYNHICAVIVKIELFIKASTVDTMSPQDYRLLLFAYSYLYFQRLMSLFNRCQRILWIIFLKEKHYTNLLRIFRHSSFLWRIQGDFDKEKEYLDILKSIDIASLSNNSDDIDLKYLELRMQAIVGT